jgi:hypothetical protein
MQHIISRFFNMQRLLEALAQSAMAAPMAAIQISSSIGLARLKSGGSLRLLRNGGGRGGLTTKDQRRCARVAYRAPSRAECVADDAMDVSQ